MIINNGDLEFLIHLENNLQSIENRSEDVTRLKTLIEKLQNQKKASNLRVLNKITEERKKNPNYGRSKEEIKKREAAKKKREQKNKNNK